MDTSAANTEPFYRFHLFNEEFGRSMKVAVGALESVKSASRAGQAPRNLTILPTGGEPWGNSTRWTQKSLSAVVDDTKRFLSHMGVVRVISAFEDFLISTEAEYDRFVSFTGGKQRQARDKALDGGPRFETVSKLVGLDAKKTFLLLPILEFFQIARNCIVHRSARASESLVQHVESGGFVKIHEEWLSERKKALPKFAKFKIGQVIPFHPRHALLASEICYRAAKLMNASLAGILGEKGFIYMAAHHTLLADRPIHIDARRSPEALVNYALFNRYLVDDHDGENTIGELQDMGKWKQCCKSFNERCLSPKKVS